MRITKNGMRIADKPTGKGWVNLVENLNDWNAENPYWTLEKGILHGDYSGGKSDNYAYTKTTYKNNELNDLVRMTRDGANSGVCRGLQPTDADNAPGYQIDMGPGYWGCLWEEPKAGMVQKYNEELADKLVKKNDWNPYDVIADGHPISAPLNGIKTIDAVHLGGFSEGAIGLQLCHGDKHNVPDVKNLYIRKLKYQIPVHEIIFSLRHPQSVLARRGSCPTKQPHRVL
ncbi:MAG: DUF1080 domain-containing protein [Chitinophagaceae bacterium]